MTDVPPELAVHREAPDRNLALELVRVTEAAAMAAGRWVGRGDKNGGDGAAVDAMRTLIGTVSMRGIVVIGEGEKDEAPMLYNGEEVGDGLGPECDVAVDPVDGTTLMAKGMPNAVAVLAVAERGTMYDPSAVFYMEKLATGPEAADVVDVTAPPAVNIARVAKAKGDSVEDVTVCILDRPRHDDLVRQVREAGARIKFISDGDVAGAIMAARDGTGVDLLLGIGGTPEGIIAACALTCMGGVLQGKLWPRDEAERRKALAGLLAEHDVPLGAGEGPGAAVGAAKGRAEADARRLADDLAQAATLRKQLDAARLRAATARLLALHLDAGHFEKWLLKEALDELVAGATTTLRQLSDGAYSLTCDDKLDFGVIDHANADERRSIRTLSGGETFLASLSLALALADRIAALAPGQVALESLFLDEGFGTLDTETLDTVASAIEQLGAEGRMVGLITHVRELAERVPTRYEVAKGHSGASIERVTS